MQYNETITDFLLKLNIDMSNIGEIMCYNKNEVNPIISRYGMYKDKQMQKVCIADIVGKERGETHSLLEELDNLFDEKGESYKRRSIPMLRYNSDEIIEKLKISFKNEPIELKEIKQDKYIVSNNGMHRVTLLRLHYYNELKKCESVDEIETLNKKYTIDVFVKKIDKIKTYSKYILNTIDDGIIVEDEINSTYLKTDNVIFSYDGVEYQKLSEQQLLERVEKLLRSSELNTKVIELASKDTYFREYLKNILDGHLLM